MLWVAGSVATALREGALQPSAGLRQAFASVQREARRQFEDVGFGIPRPETTLEPTRQLLYHVAHSDAKHPVLQELRETFDLDAAQPTETEISHAQGSLSGRNRALLDTVSAAVKEDLLRVKDVRSEEHTSELQSLMRISYAVFCLKKTKNEKRHQKHE